MELSFKSLLVPFTNKTKNIDVVQLWQVRWFSVNSWSISLHEETEHVEVFISEVEAGKFADSLRQANKLTRNTSHGKITVKKN